MIRVEKKTQKEIAEEAALYGVYAGMLKGGIPRSVCDAYVVSEDGRKIDVIDLSQSAVFNLIRNDLIESKSAKKTVYDSFVLIEALKKNGYEFSAQFILEMLKLEKIFGHIVMDLVGSTDTRLFDDAVVIAKFLKKSSGDFSYVTNEEVIKVLGKMVENHEEQKKVQNNNYGKIKMNKLKEPNNNTR